MKKSIRELNETPAASRDAFTEIIRHGAQELLQKAFDVEVQMYLEKINFERPQPVAIRNGYKPERRVQTGIGDVPIKQPRVRIKDRSSVDEKFISRILPPYLRRTRSIEELIPCLYLQGISTDDFQSSLAAILGDGAAGLSAATVTRLKNVWDTELDEWNKRSLVGKRYVYMWADGIHFNIRLTEDKRMCILVIMGVTADGNKELLAVESGYRESSMSWKNVLMSLRDRGLTTDPELAIADGALGFWAALPEVYASTKGQRCWVHKTANVLDKLPKNKQPEAKSQLHAIYNSETKAEAEKAFDRFVDVWSTKFEKAAKCLSKDREALLHFYDFPAENWCHIRTTNPIESTFATVRLRTHKTKGCGSARATEMFVFKLAQSAAKGWRKLRGFERLAEVIDIKWRFVDGIRMEAKAA